MKKEWKDLNGYRGRYRVSNTGDIVSLLRYGGDRYHILRGQITVDGYRRISLTLGDGIQRKLLAHRIVALHFLPEVEGKICINHKDFNKLNNSVDNLEWCTPYENHMYSIKAKRRIYKHGNEHFRSKLDDEVVIDLRKQFNDGKFIIHRKAHELGIHDTFKFEVGPIYVVKIQREEDPYTEELRNVTD